MNVKLLAHTAISEEFCHELSEVPQMWTSTDRDRQALALTAIRCCYSPIKPTEIIAKEGAKYFGNDATDGEEGTEADRLFRHIMRSKHTSTIEHITYTFAVEGVSRALLAQLTRHRHMSFSVQSQRYVPFGSSSKSQGFDFVSTETIDKNANAIDIYSDFMTHAQLAYDLLREAGVPQEDARMVLPNAAMCNLVLTANLRTFLDFYEKRRKGNGAQAEIADLAESIRTEITKVDPWLAAYFKSKEDK